MRFHCGGKCTGWKCPLTWKTRRVASVALVPFLKQYSWHTGIGEIGRPGERRGFLGGRRSTEKLFQFRDASSHPGEDSEAGGSRLEKGVQGPAPSLQDFYSPGGGLGARVSSPGTDPASAEGSSHTPGADKAVFDCGARLRCGLRWHYSFSAVPYFTGKAQQASNARVFKHSEGCDAINKLLCQRLNQPRCLPCQLYFWNNVFSTEIKIHVNPFLLTG